MPVSAAVLALALAGPAAAEPTQAAAPAAAHPMHGRWELVGSQAAVQAKLDRAVEDAASQLNILIREFGRMKLRTATGLCRVYAFAVTDTSWSIQCDGKKPYARPHTGIHNTTDADGDPLRSQLALSAGGAHLTWLGESGARHNVFSVDGDRLALQARVESESLERPMKWQLEYRRLAE